jgi:hypothetical protein
VAVFSDVPFEGTVAMTAAEAAREFLRLAGDLPRRKHVVRLIAGWKVRRLQYYRDRGTLDKVEPSPGVPVGELIAQQRERYERHAAIVRASGAEIAEGHREAPESFRPSGFLPIEFPEGWGLAERELLILYLSIQDPPDAPLSELVGRQRAGASGIFVLPEFRSKTGNSGRPPTDLNDWGGGMAAGP